MLLFIVLSEVSEGSGVNSGLFFSGQGALSEQGMGIMKNDRWSLLP
jgi:hypothetical protein